MSNISQMSSTLSDRFTVHLSAICSDIEPVVYQTLWQDIAVRYNETTRAYHTLRHIQQLFTRFDEVEDNLNDPHIVALALYYHDVIYDPTRSDNELRSAEHSVNQLRRYLSMEQCHRIYALIMLTATHRLNEMEGANKSCDAAYLLDIDLSILGASWSDYERYTQAVRREYTHVSTAEYTTGRSAILEKLLAHSPLYLTDHYHSQLESQARQNLKQESKLLATTLRQC